MDLSLMRRMIPTSLSVRAGRAALILSKQSPHILFGVGLVGFAATVVLSSRATLSVEDILDDTAMDLSALDIVAKNEELRKEHDYTDLEVVKNRAYIYLRSFKRLGKLYAPAIIVGGISVLALTKSHQILTARNTALTAAYVGLDKAFQAYKKRVAEELGEDKSEELYRSISIPEGHCGDTAVCGANKQHQFSPYSFFFDELSSSWKNDAERNFMFLRMQQQYANDLLTVKGHIFLNEIHDMLGVPRTTAGSVVGWILSDDGTDNFVDLGFMKPERERSRAFVNGLEAAVLIDPNVNGLIYDKIEAHKRNRG